MLNTQAFEAYLDGDLKDETGSQNWRERLIADLRLPESAGNLVLLVPLFLFPAHFNVSQILVLLLGIVALSLLSAAACGINSHLSREKTDYHLIERAAPFACLALGLATAMLVGPGFSILAGVFLAVQGVYMLGRERFRFVKLLLMATLLIVRLDAGVVALEIARSAELMLFAGLLGMFLVICQERQRAVQQARLNPMDRFTGERMVIDFTLGACVLLMIGTYAAFLAADPIMVSEAGAMAFASVPCVVLGLMRCWWLAASPRLEAPMHMDILVWISVIAWALSASLVNLPI